MSSSSQMKYGAALSFVSFGLSFSISLFLTPLLIRGIGREQYGLYQLIGATIAYLGLLDFGFGAAITRYVAKYNAENDVAGRENFLGMSLIIYSCLVVVGLIAGLVMLKNLSSIFPNLTSEELADARVMMYFLMASFSFSLIGNVFTGALTGSQEFIFVRTLAIVNELLRACAILLIIQRNYGAVELTIMISCLSFTFWIMCVIYFFRRLRYRVTFKAWDKVLFREMLGFSIFIFLGQVMSVLYWRIGVLMLGIVSTTSAVAVYAVAMNLNNIFLAIVNALNSVLLPKLTHMVVRKATGQEKTEFIARVGRIILFVYGYLFIGFACFGREFINLWVGPDYKDAWVVTMIVVSAAAIPRIQGAANNLMQAMNKHRFMSIIYVIMGLLNAGVAYGLAKPYGLVGIAIATAISLIVGNVLIANIFYQKVLGVHVSSYFRIILHRVGISLMISTAVASVIGALPFDSYAFPMLSGWPGLCVKGIVFSVFYFGLMWIYAMRHDERELIASMLPSYFRSTPKS